MIMRNVCLLILLLLPCQVLLAQSEGGIEQYHYIGTHANASVVPVVHLQSRKGWYGEARYNYDEQNTFSFLAGKSFTHKHNLEYTWTPMIGVAIGDLNGFTGAMNFSLSHERFFINTQSQYTFSSVPQYGNFLFNWWEMGYQPLSWLYGGVSFQHTKVAGEKTVFEPGLMAGIEFRKVSFPVYVFNAFNPQRFFVLGVNWEWHK